MEILSKGKGILGIVAIFIVAMFLYNLFFKPEVSTVVSDLETSNVGNELLKMREALQAVTLDQSLFSSIGFINLVDYTNPVPSQPTGRSNPFNTIGRD